MKDRAEIDWHSIESHYRAGIRSLRCIAKEFGGTEGAIRKKAKLLEWERDLTEKIKIATQEKVRKLEYAQSTQKLIDDKGIIQNESDKAAQVLFGHRKLISRSRELGNSLLLELEQQTILIEQFKKLGELMSSDDGFDKMNAIYQKVISTPGRIDSFKKLTDAQKTFIGLERQALNINDNANGDANKPVIDKSELSAADAYKAMLTA